MTYTVVTMEVPAEFYDLVYAKLKAAGYDHAIDDDKLDMTHIALTRGPLLELSVDDKVIRALARHLPFGAAGTEQMRKGLEDAIRELFAA